MNFISLSQKVSLPEEQVRIDIIRFLAINILGEFKYIPICINNLLEE